MGQIQQSINNSISSLAVGVGSSKWLKGQEKANEALEISNTLIKDKIAQSKAFYDKIYPNPDNDPGLEAGKQQQAIIEGLAAAGKGKEASTVITGVRLEEMNLNMDEVEQVRNEYKEFLRKKTGGRR